MTSTSGCIHPQGARRLPRRAAAETLKEQPLADSEVLDPPNDLDGPEPELPHLEHGVHDDQPAPDPGINPNVP